MRSKRLAVVAVFGLMPFLAINAMTNRAAAKTPDGTWLVSDRVAIEVFDCAGLLCGRIVWLRQPVLRIPAMCGRTIVWGLRQTSPDQWDDGAFFDPENGSTYNLTAELRPDGTISARIYEGIQMFGRTEILRRIAPRSLQGWC